MERLRFLGLGLMYGFGFGFELGLSDAFQPWLTTSKNLSREALAIMRLV